jgi:hypothetical protein
VLSNRFEGLSVGVVHIVVHRKAFTAARESSTTSIATLPGLEENSRKNVKVCTVPSDSRVTGVSIGWGAGMPVGDTNGTEEIVRKTVNGQLDVASPLAPNSLYF